MEIKFRGKRVDNGEWVYGLLVYQNHIRVFSPCKSLPDEDGKIYEWADIQEYEVIKDTVGQSTGHYDKNKIEIFNGDIVSFYVRNDYFNKILKTGYVFWNDKLGGWYIQDFIKYQSKANLYVSKNVKIIGNIFDNKELLEEEI